MPIPPIVPLGRVRGLPTPEFSMRIKMLEDAKGMPDGITLTRYMADEEYDVPNTLAKCFFDMGAAELLDVIEVSPLTFAEETPPVEEVPTQVPDVEEDPVIDPERENLWMMTTEPQTYLFRYPNGPSAALAKYVLGRTDVRPE